MHAHVEAESTIRDSQFYYLDQKIILNRQRMVLHSYKHINGKDPGLVTTSVLTTFVF